MYRRDFAKQLGTALLTGGLIGELQASSQESSPSTSQANMPHAMPSGPPLQIAMLVYPGMRALDLVAPQAIFSELMSTRVELVWKSKETVTSDTGIPIVPTMTFAGYPADPDIRFVGGGTKGTWALTNNPVVIGFLQSRGAKAKLVTSVCTGSLVLGAAGLLNGYKATSHWVARELLPEWTSRSASPPGCVAMNMPRPLNSLMNTTRSRFSKRAIFRTRAQRCGIS